MSAEEEALHQLELETQRAEAALLKGLDNFKRGR